MIPHTGDFLLVGNLPPTSEGKRIHRAEGLLGVDNILHFAALTQPPVVLWFLHFNNNLRTCCVFSEDDMACQKRRSTLLKWSKNFLQQNEHHPVRIFLKSAVAVFFLFSFTCLISVKKGKISVSASHILSAADANETSY